MSKPLIPADATPATIRSALGYVGEQEICALLGIQPLTLRNRISMGKAPPSFKVGNEHLFDAAEVQAWIRRRRFTPGQA